MNIDGICLGVFFVAVLQSTHAQSLSGLCNVMKIENGVGYSSHPKECDKYVQCRNDGSGVLTDVVQQCAFSTYWENSLLTCVPVWQSTCPHDKCANKPDGEIRIAMGNCRGYWQCAGKRSEPMCCPVGQKYDANFGCIDAAITECNDTCFNDNAMVSDNSTMLNETTVDEVPVKVCDDFRDAGVIGKYEQLVAGWGWIELPCAPGTVFVKALCKCEDRTEVNSQPHACKAEIHLPFTHDHNDESSPAYFVKNENVEVVDGVAKFNGVNSRLIIPRFANLEHSTTVVIRVKYSSNHTLVQGRARAIVSNGACNNVPSIMIAEDESFVHFGVGTSNNTLAFANVDQLDKREKDVVYAFDNGALVGSNGVNKKSASATGYLRNVRCALQIGAGNDLRPFEGEIDELTVYLCRPGML